MIYRNDAFNSLFDQLVDRALDLPRPGGTAETRRTVRWTPSLDAFVDGEHLVLQVMLAGVRPDAVELTATGNRLTIKGSRERHSPANGADFRLREVVYGDFERTLELPEGTDANKAEARFENGVLEVRLPAAGAFVPRKIEIQGAKADSGDAGAKLHAA